MIDFDSAARWSSFKLAAQELHKTPAAVSLQIKQLEQEVGFALFIRYPRHIALTEKGRELALTVARALGDLRAKVAGLQDGDEERILRISTTHSFAIKCLVPRMGGFTRLYPELDVRLDVGDHKVNLDDDSTDVAIRYGPAQDGDPALLCRERLVAVYSPALLAPGRAALSLADLPAMPLLYEHSTDLWLQFLKENQVLAARYDFSRRYNNWAVLAQAAIAGQGVALVAYGIVHEDLRQGALRRIDARSAPHHDGYRFLVNRRKAEMSKVRRFHAWLRDEMAQMQASAAAGP